MQRPLPPPTRRTRSVEARGGRPISERGRWAQIEQDIGRCAYVHYVSEIYVPGSAGDDQEKHPTYPVAGGLLKEAKAESDAESVEAPVDNV